MSKGRIKKVPVELISSRVTKYEFMAALYALPEDALFIGTESNAMGGYDLIFSSEEWEDIQWGDPTPVFIPTVTAMEVDKLKRQLFVPLSSGPDLSTYWTPPEQNSFPFELSQSSNCICDMEYTGRTRHLPECPLKALK